MGIGATPPKSYLGQIIGGYRLTEYIGACATGLIFRGERAADTPVLLECTNSAPLEFPREAAIKLLIPQLGASEEEFADFRARFRREAMTLKRMDHPNILPIIDYGEDTTAGFTFMILRYMLGGNLATVIDSHGPFAPSEVSRILGQIAAALDYAHGNGVVHRDVKPANILLDGAGTPYLRDFSIARLLVDTASHRTTTGCMLGTSS